MPVETILSLAELASAAHPSGHRDRGRLAEHSQRRHDAQQERVETFDAPPADAAGRDPPADGSRLRPDEAVEEVVSWAATASVHDERRAPSKPAPRSPLSNLHAHDPRGSLSIDDLLAGDPAACASCIAGAASKISGLCPPCTKPCTTRTCNSFAAVLASHHEPHRSLHMSFGKF